MSDNKIVVKNTCVIINDYNFGDCEKLENYFRIYNMISRSYYYIGLHYDVENKRLFLPRGIDIFFIENIFNTKAHVEKNMYNEYQVFDNILIKYLTRDDNQKTALRFMLGEGEYFATKYKSQLQINLNTGKGKTYLAIATMAYTGIKTIVITYSTSILNQWKDRTMEYCNMSKKDIYNISGSGCIYRLLNMDENRLNSIKLFLVTHATLKSYSDTHGWDKLNELFKILRIGIKVYDEAHLNFENMCKIDFYTNVYKTFYISATPARSSEEQNRIYQLSFKNILAIDLFDEENDPHTDYIAIKYNSKPTPQQISQCKNQYGLNRNKYTNTVVNSNYFYMLIRVLIDIIENNLLPHEKCLIYIGTNEAIVKVYNWIIQNYPEYRYNIGIYTSIVEEQDKVKALNKRLILSTTKSAGAAVDIKDLKMTIVLAEPFKSEVLARQTLGRTRNDNTMYIDIVDTGYFHCSKYFSYKKNIFTKYAKDVSVIDISENELISRSDKLIEKRNNHIMPVQYL